MMQEYFQVTQYLLGERISVRFRDWQKNYMVVSFKLENETILEIHRGGVVSQTLLFLGEANATLVFAVLWMLSRKPEIVYHLVLDGRHKKMNADSLTLSSALAALLLWEGDFLMNSQFGVSPLGTLCGRFAEYESVMTWGHVVRALHTGFEFHPDDGQLLRKLVWKAVDEKQTWLGMPLRLDEEGRLTETVNRHKALDEDEAYSEQE